MASDAVVHLIDDDDGVRQAVAFLLTTSGFAVRVYESANGFLEALASVQPGCIVTDVRMPGLDGLTLQRELKGRGCMLPVIVITGHADVPLAVEAMKAGAVDFIEKPFNDEALLSAIRVAIDRHA
jgi:two-component system response regulator FixJ